MKINKTKIPGLFIVKPKIHNDKRGFFFESYVKKRYYRNCKKIFNQDNLSLSKKNVLRGIHFQWKKPQAQILHLLSGKIFIVFVDFRFKSKTFLKKVELIIDSKKKTQIIMPPGVGSGFYSLSKNNLMHYKVSEYYNPRFEMGVNWKCKKINVNWPKGKKILSKKDRLNPFTSELDFKNFQDLNKVGINA